MTPMSMTNSEVIIANLQKKNKDLELENKLLRTLIFNHHEIGYLVRMAETWGDCPLCVDSGLFSREKENG